MTTQSEFDYIIIGGGLAGLQLALAFCDDSYFKDKRIGIIEPTPHKGDDKTWCFWEKGSGKWDDILHHKWSEGLFYGKKEGHSLDMGPYLYKMIRSEDFYTQALEKLKGQANVELIIDTVTHVMGQKVIGKENSYIAHTLFDSRITSDYSNHSKSITLYQPFKGWVIETKEDCFEPNTFTMMDYRVGFKDLCCFTYVLPTSKRQALVEFTFFVPELVESEVYDRCLKQYIQDCLNIEEYSISKIEEGVIPMSSYPFWEANQKKHLKIGTAGGWVKACSGYAFKNIEKKVARIIDNLKKGHQLDHKLFNKRYRLYDKVLLNILHGRNELGVGIFEEMYQKNSTEEILQFLDEETTFAKEFFIINKFNKAPFLKSVGELLIR